MVQKIPGSDSGDMKEEKEDANPNREDSWIPTSDTNFVSDVGIHVRLKRTQILYDPQVLAK
jgi:hypothetical protein